MKITSRTVGYETRYFAETDDGFDGTAQGHGYRSVEKLKKAYWFYKNRGRLSALKGEAKKFLRENQDVANAVRDYFTAQNALYAFKEGTRLSWEGLVEELERSPDSAPVADKIRQNQRLWKSIEALI